MIVNVLKKIYLGYLFFSCVGCFGRSPDIHEAKIDWNNKNHSDNFKNYLGNYSPCSVSAMLSFSHNNHCSESKGNNYNPYIAHMSVSDFQHVFRSISNQHEILSNYELYAYQNFCTFARTLPCYQEFMLSLQHKITHDKSFRKNTACVPGFEYSFGLRHETSGFHNFVNSEASNILTMQSKQVSEIKGTLRVNDYQSLDVVANNCTQKIHGTSQANVSGRLTERINAINVTWNQQGKVFDYSSQVAGIGYDGSDGKVFNNTYGTQLDCQLHKELMQTRDTMHNLERIYYNDPYVQVLAPVVYRYTVQAKNEQCPLAAFELSDFCYTITQVVVNGMDILYDASSAIGKGAIKSAHIFVSPEHWKEMATGVVQLGLLFADAVGQEDALHYAVVLAATSENSGTLARAAEHYCLHTQAQKDAINWCVQKTYKKIQAMPWQELLENGTEIGTTMILDTLALHAVNGFSCAASNLVVKELQSALESGALLTEQYVVEVAGFGKLIVEEGAELSPKATDVLKNNSAFLKNENKCGAQLIKEIDGLSQLINEAPIALAKVNSVWEATTFATGKLEQHFNKHVIKKAEWGTNISMTIDEYLNQAQTLLNKEISGCIDGFISKEGWVFKYNKITNELAIAKPNGIIETLFRPTEGINYWINQIKKYK